MAQFNLGANSICSVYTFSLLIALLSRTGTDDSGTSRDATSGTKVGGPSGGATTLTRSHLGAIGVHVEEHTRFENAGDSFGSHTGAAGAPKPVSVYFADQRTDEKHGHELSTF